MDYSLWIGFKTMTSINLLPWRKTQRAQIKRKRIYYAMSLVAILMFVVTLAYYCVNHHSMARRVQTGAVQINHQRIAVNSGKYEAHSLTSLHYIGLIKNTSKQWALISPSEGEVAIVVRGDYLGKEHGRVMQIQEKSIEIEKTLWSSEGLVKTSVLLSLRQKNKGS